MSERPTFHVPTAAEWFERFPDLGRTPLFTMRVRLGRGHLVTIRAYEGPVCSTFGHTRLFCELKLGSAQRKGPPLFPRELFYVGIPSHMSIDGKKARETVLSLFALKPGDTDAEFFDDYTDEQRAFVCTWGEELSMEAERRFGGER